MNALSAAQIINCLAPEAKARMLAILCHDLTVVARDTYGEGLNVKDPARLRAINEIQHRMTSLLIRILDDGGQDNGHAIAASFFGEREDKHLEHLLAFAFTRVAQVIQKPLP